YPDASCGPIDLDIAEADAPAHDLVILHADAASAEHTQQMLDYARASLKTGGILLLLGTHPVAWLDFVAGARPGWWSALADDGTPASCQYPVSYWQGALAQQGYACGPLAEFTPDTHSGPYLLAATAQAQAQTPADHSQPASRLQATPAVQRGWLLLAGAHDADAALAEALAARLSAAGCRTSIQRDTDPAKFDAMLAQAKSRLVQIDGIIHLDGLAQAQDITDPAALLQAQVRRCALAAAAAQALERANSSATLWLLT